MTSKIIQQYKSFSKLDLIIKLAFTWSIMAIFALLFYINAKHFIAWLVIIASIIPLGYVIFLCTNSNQSVTLYEDSIALDLPRYSKNNYIANDRTNIIIPLMKLNDICVSDIKKGVILIEYEGNSIYLQHFIQSEEIVSKTKEAKSKIK